MSENTARPRDTKVTPTEEKSLLGSGYSYTDVGRVTTQTTEQLADNGED